MYAAVGIVGALSAISGNITVGQLSSFLIYANQYTKPFNEISGVVTELQTAVASARRIFEVLDEQDEIPDAPEAAAVKTCRGNVQIEKVSFSYLPGPEADRRAEPIRTVRTAHRDRRADGQRKNDDHQSPDAVLRCR